MKVSPHALAAALAMLSISAWAQFVEGPVRPLSAPPAYPSAPPSTAVRPMSSALPAVVPRPPSFAAAAVAGATRSTVEAREERRFLRDAAAQSRFELEASHLAFGKSSNPGVRTLAASMINHNQTTGLELAHLLSSRGMALPMLGEPQRKTLKQLARIDGKKFDTTYLQQVGLTQAGVARDYEKSAQVISDPQVNGWIVKNQPTARYHQMLAEKASTPGPAPRVNRASSHPSLVKLPAAGGPVIPETVSGQHRAGAATTGFQPTVAAPGGSTPGQRVE